MSLLTAVYEGDSEKVRRLLDSGANIEERDPLDGSTPLYAAAEMRKEGIVRLLIERGANIEARNSRGETPLIVAAVMGSLPIVQQLIDAKADVNAVSHLGTTPLMSAMHRSKEDIVRLLVNNNADMNTETMLGQTPLISAIERGLVSIVRFLLDSGASVNPPYRLETPLHAAVKSGNEELVRMLLQKGADTRAKNYFGQTPAELVVVTPSIRALLKSAETRNRARAAGEALTVKPIHEVAARLEGTNPAADTARKYLPPGIPEQIARFLHKKQGGRKTRRKRAYKLSRKRQWRGL